LRPSISCAGTRESEHLGGCQSDVAFSKEEEWLLGLFTIIIIIIITIIIIIIIIIVITIISIYVRWMDRSTRTASTHPMNKYWGVCFLACLAK
jgi:heme/copper-type cytochrome/quinol oxidase subunit 2